MEIERRSHRRKDSSRSDVGGRIESTDDARLSNLAVFDAEEDSSAARVAVVRSRSGIDSGPETYLRLFE